MFGKKNNPYVCTDEEVEIILKGMEDPDVFTNYFFRRPGEKKGWLLDDNFTERGKWQKAVHHATQNRIMVIGGFGCGKTRGIALSACVWCATTRDFSFLNAAPRSWQSELMYQFILDISEETPFKNLIFEAPKKPYPKIVLKFWAKNVLIQSTMEFMSVDKNAKGILSWEGDWINVDEAGLLDNLDEIIRNLGSRLRGHAKGRERLARMSFTSNSWDNPEMWIVYDMAKELPDDYLSITVDSRENKNISEQQLKQMLKDIPESEHEQFISGLKPRGRGSYFPISSILKCESKEYGEFILERCKSNTPGYAISTLYGVGVNRMETPVVPGNSYILLADPGAENAPGRNAPVIMVWDVTEFPREPMKLVYFWWGNGNGSINPFVHEYIACMNKWVPIFSGVDSTGTQKNMATLINDYLLGDRLANNEKILGVDTGKMVVKSITGLDFSSSKKVAYLLATKLMLEAGLLLFPNIIIGIKAQLGNYDPEKDKLGLPKIPQDIVATVAMSCHVARSLFQINPADFIRRGEERAPTQISFENYRNLRFQRQAGRNEERVTK